MVDVQVMRVEQILTVYPRRVVDAEQFIDGWYMRAAAPSVLRRGTAGCQTAVHCFQHSTLGASAGAQHLRA